MIGAEYAGKLRVGHGALRSGTFQTQPMLPLTAGKLVRPIDIILKGDVSNPKSIPLRDSAARLMK